MKSMRVLLLMHEDLVPPDDLRGVSEEQQEPWRTERDVWLALQSLGHEVLKLGVYSDLGVIRAAIEEFQPHITFNLIEDFHGVAVYDQHVVSFLELMRKPYTGCNPRGLLLSRDKALSKSLLMHHRIRTPDFAVFAPGRRIARPRRLEFPLLVKSLTNEGSAGIAQASIVHDDDKLRERVEFIHRTLEDSAIVESFVAGREFYVGMMGNERLRTFPVWELMFENLPDDAAAIATAKVKWDRTYQERVGVYTQQADVPPELTQKIYSMCKRAYRALNISGYARMDLRYDHEGHVHLIEANPNPQLAEGEDFAESAAVVGISYEQLLSRIMNLGLAYRPAWSR